MPLSTVSRRCAGGMGEFCRAVTGLDACYGEFEATINIGTLAVIEGQLPRRALNLVQEWAMIHKEELLEDWRLCRENAPPTKIEPLA
jgi:hypothetical protein